MSEEFSRLKLKGLFIIYKERKSVSFKEEFKLES